MAKYSSLVERWRPLAEKYFPPEVVDKVLYTIQGESGGNPSIVGDGGAALGLFQSHYVKSTDPEAQFRDAARLYEGDLRNGGTGFGDWGEGRLYQGRPFGALGNNPYPGGATNARASSGVTPLAGTTQAQQKKKASIGDFIGSKIAGIASKAGTTAKNTPPAYSAPTSSNRFSGYAPTGSFKDDTQGYFAEAQKAWDDLSRYQASSSDVLVVDEETGIVVKLMGTDEITGEPIYETDIEGTRIAQRAVNATKALDRLYDAKQAGLVDSGESAAQAYLNAARGEAEEATRKYEDYSRRISDLVAIEDVPIQRAQTLAATLNSINEANSKRESRFSPKGVAPNVKTTNMAPYAEAIRSTIPSEAPGFVGIPSGAFQSPSAPTSTGVKIPASDPNEVLANMNISPAVPPGIGAGTGGVGQVTPNALPTQTQMPSPHTNSGYYQGPTIDRKMIDTILGAVNYPPKRFAR